MYQHIGKKLKVLAKVWCTLGVMGSVAAAVLMYLAKLPLLTWLPVGIGGIVFSILSSWGIYAVGDIHVKLERLEDKLIPKPSYTDYLGTSQTLRGQCEICGKTTDLIDAKIVDGMGTRYRKVCRECFGANHCESADK